MFEYVSIFDLTFDVVPLILADALSIAHWVALLINHSHKSINGLVNSAYPVGYPVNFLEARDL